MITLRVLGNQLIAVSFGCQNSIVEFFDGLMEQFNITILPRGPTATTSIFRKAETLMVRQLFGSDEIRGQVNSCPTFMEIALTCDRDYGKIFVKQARVQQTNSWQKPGWSVVSRTGKGTKTFPVSNAFFRTHQQSRNGALAFYSGIIVFKSIELPTKWHMQ